MAIKVLIIGAGTGGLCLAQGQKASGVEVEVYERDASPLDRLQGYRLHISAGGSRALQACLPQALFEEFLTMAASPNDRVTMLDHRLRTLLTIGFPVPKRACIHKETPISRITLRRLLLRGLDDVVRFNKQFVAFEDAAHGRVAARFSDGTMALGDVLVGADGAGSRLRH